MFDYQRSYYLSAINVELKFINSSLTVIVTLSSGLKIKFHIHILSTQLKELVKLPQLTLSANNTLGLNVQTFISQYVIQPSMVWEIVGKYIVWLSFA